MLSKTAKLFSAELNKNLYPISTNDYFNRTKVSAYNLFTMRSIVKKNSKHTGDKKVLNILDWGCGNSLWAFALFPGASVTGVDISEDNLNYSKINAKKNASKFRGFLYNRDITQLKKNTFDCSISISGQLAMFLHFCFIFLHFLSDFLKMSRNTMETNVFAQQVITWILRNRKNQLLPQLCLYIVTFQLGSE